MTTNSSESERGTRRERVAWCLFDFASSPFTTIALTAFGAPYFRSVLAQDGLDLGPIHLGGSSAWGLSVSIAMALVTITSPIMGAYADRSSKKRALLGLYVMMCAIPTLALAFVPPGAALAAFLLYIVANFAFEGGYVFYNAFLPELAAPERIGRLSGLGWAVGYVGGLLALAVCLPLIPEQYDAAHAAKGSLTYVVVAAWYVIVGIPVVLVLRERRASGATDARGLVRGAFADLGKTLRSLRGQRSIWLFLLAYLLFTDALNTVIAFTGVYTDEVLGFTPGENIVLFLVLNVIAAPGAYVFGVMQDRFGGIRSLRVTLVLWGLVVVLALFATTKGAFWPVAVLAAIVIGATQSASRAVMARMAPRDRMAEYMGLLSLSGKASSVVGPLVYGVIADSFERPGSPGFGQRVALGAVGTFFVVAFFMLGGVREQRVEAT